MGGAGSGFNSRAREGRDGHNLPQQKECRSFNSRAREGRDEDFQGMRKRMDVSIHAPARGATSESTTPRQSGLFQFTRPRGARPPVRHAWRYRLTFQFTRPRGARPARTARTAAERCFNSRAREGRDAWRRVFPCLWRRFNSRAREGRDKNG